MQHHRGPAWEVAADEFGNTYYCHLLNAMGPPAGLHGGAVCRRRRLPARPGTPRARTAGARFRAGACLRAGAGAEAGTGSGWWSRQWSAGPPTGKWQRQTGRYALRCSLSRLRRQQVRASRPWPSAPRPRPGFAMARHPSRDRPKAPPRAAWATAKGTGVYMLSRAIRPALSNVEQRSWVHSA
jgi:hypothetical protein